jgi:hypothetical protein
MMTSEALVRQLAEIEEKYISARNTMNAIAASLRKGADNNLLFTQRHMFVYACDLERDHAHARKVLLEVHGLIYQRDVVAYYYSTEDALCRGMINLGMS